MALYLEVFAGENKGSKYRIVEGARMGRTTGEILIPDKKISGLHAQIEKEQDGQFCLVDRNSSNGLTVSGQRVQRVALSSGVLFVAGKTTFRVVDLEGNIPDSTPASFHWRDVLARDVPQLIAQNSIDLGKIKPFDPAIKLTVTEGMQTDREFLLGYGPRKFGSQVLDVEIEDPESPAIAFELHPESGKALFMTTDPKTVLINDKPANSTLLKAGDQIRIGKTVLRVSYES